MNIIPLPLNILLFLLLQGLYLKLRWSLSSCDLLKWICDGLFHHTAYDETKIPEFPLLPTSRLALIRIWMLFGRLEVRQIAIPSLKAIIDRGGRDDMEMLPDSFWSLLSPWRQMQEFQDCHFGPILQ